MDLKAHLQLRGLSQANPAANRTAKTDLFSRYDGDSVSKKDGLKRHQLTIYVDILCFNKDQLYMLNLVLLNSQLSWINPLIHIAWIYPPPGSSGK